MRSRFALVYRRGSVSETGCSSSVIFYVGPIRDDIVLNGRGAAPVAIAAGELSYVADLWVLTTVQQQKNQPI